MLFMYFFFFFFNDTATTEIYTLSLHDALPISERSSRAGAGSCATLRIFSRLGLGILAFGRFSGKLIFGFRSGDSVPLTRRQREILDFISGHITERGFAPSFEEIAARFAFRSLATVHEHLTNLERKGYIHRAHNDSRAIEVVPPKGQTGATELP